MKVGQEPLLPYHRPGDPALAALAATTVKQWGERDTAIRAVMLARLGPNVCHDSVEAAAAVLEELEELAKRPDWRCCCNPNTRHWMKPLGLNCSSTSALAGSAKTRLGSCHPNPAAQPRMRGSAVPGSTPCTAVLSTLCL